MAIVEVKDLVKTFPAHRSLRAVLRHPFDQPQTGVLNGVDLTLERQQIVGVLGSNGAGKTTLLKVIATLIAPTSGSVTVDGWDVETAIRKARSSVSYCFTEERSFYWRLTGRQNLEFFAALNGLSGESGRRRIEELASRLGLDSYMGVPFARFSSGIKQRFALARALLASPRVLLLDEPTRSVDPAEASSIWSWIRDELVARDGLSVILVTHQVAEAVAVCDRVGVLKAGRLSELLAPTDVQQMTEGMHGLTLTLEGLQVTELPRLRALHGIREVAYSERNGQQQLEVWCDDTDEALSDLVAVTTSAGARVRGFERGAPISEVLETLGRRNGVHAR